MHTESVIEEVQIKQSSSAKRKSKNNQKHLVKILRATQRDQLLLKQTKDDVQFRKTLANTLQELNQVFVESLHGISQSMTNL